jgi:hypothetical protein
LLFPDDELVDEVLRLSNVDVPGLVLQGIEPLLEFRVISAADGLISLVIAKLIWAAMCKKEAKVIASSQLQSIGFKGSDSGFASWAFSSHFRFPSRMP